MLRNYLIKIWILTLCIKIDDALSKSIELYSFSMTLTFSQITVNLKIIKLLNIAENKLNKIWLNFVYHILIIYLNNSIKSKKKINKPNKTKTYKNSNNNFAFFMYL